MKFVKIPNCPENAETVLIAQNTPNSIVDGLKNAGINILFGSYIPYAVNAVSCHIDTQIAYLGEGDFVVHPSLLEYYNKILPDAYILAGKSSAHGTYPDDIAYNIASNGKYAIHNFNFTDELIKNKVKGEMIQVSQGYSKCSLCIVNENSFITEDEGIANTLKRHNIDVLKISEGDVMLPGLDYGFLGGASGKISKNIIAFSGNISRHRDYKKIYNFCAERNVELLSLSDEKLIDVGSIVPVIEKE